MTRMIMAVILATTLVGCSSISFHTNVNNDALSKTISTRASRQDLQQFPNDQVAHQSGATLLGRVTGESCQGDGDSKEHNLSYDRSKSQAINLLKNDVIQRGGNAFTLNICHGNSRL